MIIHTTRFGQIDIEESKFITMQRPILGFDSLKHFILFPGQGSSPLWWFQSVQDPAVAFVVVNPLVIKPDYDPEFPDHVLEFLEIKNMEDIALLVIVNSCSDPFRVTANLKAPLLINAANKRAGQVILDDPDCPIQYDLVGNKANLCTHEAEERPGACLLNNLAHYVTAAM